MPQHDAPIIKMIEDMAANSFKDHVLTVNLDVPGPYRSYRCMKPNDWNYGFDVTFTPGWVFQYGDVGHLSLSRVVDMMTWLRTGLTGHQIDFDYIASKAPHEIKTKEWTDESAKRAIKRMFTDYDSETKKTSLSIPKRVLGDLLNFNHRGEFDEMIVPKLQKLRQDWYEHDMQDWCPSFLWSVLALRWCVKTIDAKSKEDANVLSESAG